MARKFFAITLGQNGQNFNIWLKWPNYEDLDYCLINGKPSLKYLNWKSKQDNQGFQFKRHSLDWFNLHTYFNIKIKRDLYLLF